MKKLPVEPDIQYQQVFTIDTIIPYEEYNVNTNPLSLNVGPLTIEQGKKFGKLLTEFTDLFAHDIADLGRTDLVTHRIYTEEGPPIRSRPYSSSPTEQIFIKEEIQHMLDTKLIQPSSSPWTSPVVLVRKKNGKLRFCVDYWKLNSVTKKDAYPLP